MSKCQSDVSRRPSNYELNAKQAIKTNYEVREKLPCRLDSMANRRLISAMVQSFDYVHVRAFVWFDTCEIKVRICSFWRLLVQHPTSFVDLSQIK